MPACAPSPASPASLTRRRWLAAAALAAGGAAPWARASDEAALLTVHLGGAGRPAVRRDFDRAALAALPQHTVVTRTPWYPQARRFTGPLLRDVLAAAGADVAQGVNDRNAGGRLTAVALNDYRVEIPLEDLVRWPLVLAHRVDDRQVAVRDNGPLMLMYPFDDEPALRSARYWGRAVWQLRTIELR